MTPLGKNKVFSWFYLVSTKNNLPIIVSAIVVASVVASITSVVTSISSYAKRFFIQFLFRSPIWNFVKDCINWQKLKKLSPMKIENTWSWRVAFGLFGGFTWNGIEERLLFVVKLFSRGVVSCFNFAFFDFGSCFRFRISIGFRFECSFLLKKLKKNYKLI